MRIASQLAASASRRCDPVHACESRLVSLLLNTVLDGVQIQDLQLLNSQRPTALAFTLYVLGFCGRSPVDMETVISQLGKDKCLRAPHDGTEILLDALGWRPLSGEWDYGATRDSIRRELFASEWAQVLSAGEPRPS
jgi:hypothetical protein